MVSCGLLQETLRIYEYVLPSLHRLMFGPKNAPGTQVQYLYLPCKENIVGGARSIDDLKEIKPLRGLVLTITQFDGIPMADVFKVMQYWTFETVGLPSQTCMVRVGVAMHYIKSTMFKSQILNGTKEELGDQVSLSSAMIMYCASFQTLHSGEELVFLFGIIDSQAESSRYSRNQRW